MHKREIWLSTAIYPTWELSPEKTQTEISLLSIVQVVPTMLLSQQTAVLVLRQDRVHIKKSEVQKASPIIFYHQAHHLNTIGAKVWQSA